MAIIDPNECRLHIQNAIYAEPHPDRPTRLGLVTAAAISEVVLTTHLAAELELAQLAKEQIECAIQAIHDVVLKGLLNGELVVKRQLGTDLRGYMSIVTAIADYLNSCIERHVNHLDIS